jgi:hypothetical protein
MTDLLIEFDNNENYQTGGPAVHLGVNLGYGSLEGYRLEGDFVILDFGNGRFRKIPVRRLLRITEG